MKRSQGRYYLGRVHKVGTLDADKLLEEILSPPIVRVGQYAWTITDAQRFFFDEELHFVFGMLSKFEPEGTINVVDTQEKSRQEVLLPDLLVASSPFIYIPRYSGIVFLHIWNKIEVETFIRRFCRVVSDGHIDVMGHCEIDLISDIRSFVAKLQAMDAITEIGATVRPPNPLFGPAWKKLKEYLEKRRAAEMRLREVSAKDSSLTTTVVKRAIELIEDEVDIDTIEPLDVTDAALLMAADGYGHGKVVGVANRSRVIIKTSETHVSFIFDKEPSPEHLYLEASRHFDNINKERGLKHK